MSDLIFLTMNLVGFLCGDCLRLIHIAAFSWRLAWPERSMIVSGTCLAFGGSLVFLHVALPPLLQRAVSGLHSKGFHMVDERPLKA